MFRNSRVITIMCIQPTKALPGAHAGENVPRRVNIWQLSPLRMRMISYWDDGAGDSHFLS